MSRLECRELIDSWVEQTHNWAQPNELIRQNLGGSGMSSEWSKVRIDQLGDVKSGKRLPLDHSLVQVATPFPYIRLVDVDAGRVQKGKLQFLKPETRECIKRYVVNTGDVCLAIVGHTIGMVFYVERDFNTDRMAMKIHTMGVMCHVAGRGFGHRAQNGIEQEQFFTHGRLPFVLPAFSFSPRLP